MEGKKRQELVETYIERYNNFDIEGMLSCLSESVLFENETAGEVDARTEGRSQFKELAEQSAQLFSARKQTITSFENVEEKLVAHIAYRAVLASDLPNGLKAGETIELTGKSEFEFTGDKISRIKDII
ncbi:nuclear transport factor 2 family protein [Marinimicrobium sp. ABcell2]|uniref:nuclear transport factor 2 family protein n=1 Tax=Marinimicrobium sp. ABcell2 TaxID=3069751 RepID=UPI0027B5A7B2|nr:nuclear transport factor 2 family protein [Marinimicrobium sp. ABcell2]MDQ2078416.1 nuclear transport factor 2 family protein [Marinimicrobium sp. ABcell2]